MLEPIFINFHHRVVRSLRMLCLDKDECISNPCGQYADGCDNSEWPYKCTCKAGAEVSRSNNTSGPQCVGKLLNRIPLKLQTIIYLSDQFCPPPVFSPLLLPPPPRYKSYVVI